MRRFLTLLLLLNLLPLAQGGFAQVPIINTLGGQPSDLSGLPATQFPIASATAIGADFTGNSYVSFNSYIYKITLAGNYTKIAGTGVCGFSGDSGPATSAAICSPSYLIPDGAGNLYVSDSGNNRVRVISSSGVISTLVGGLNYPRGLALDGSGNLYIADSNNCVIRKFDTSSNLTTVAGNGICTFNTEGPAAGLSTALLYPSSVAVDAVGNLYVADSNQRIREMDTSGNMVTFLGFIYNPDVHVAPSGDIVFEVSGCCYALQPYIINNFGYYSFTYLGQVGPQVVAVKPPAPTSFSNIAGVLSEMGFNGDGISTNSWLNFPNGLAYDGSGNLFINDAGNNRVRRVDASGNMTTVAGNGSCCFGGDNYPLADAFLASPFGVAFDGLGNMFIDDRGNQRIRKVDTSGTVSTVAGTGTFGKPIAGPATSSSFNSPMAIAADASGNFYIADTGNNSIEKVDTSGQLTIIATANQPQGITVDGNGNVYFSDTGSQTVRKLDSAGNVTTVAGIGTAGFSGDGGSALSANLTSPAGVAVDSAGSIYIADSGNERIRKVDVSGIIHTVAGNGACYLSNDGSALSSALCDPFGLSFVNSTGALLITETGSNTRVRILYPSGNIKTIAGNGDYGFSGDGGSSYSANLSYPYGVAIDASGNLYIADTNNQRIREVTGAPLSEPPTDLLISQVASSNVVSPGSSITYTLTVTNLGPNSASALLVTDNLPASVNFVSCSSTGSGVCGGAANNRTVSFDSLPNGNSQIVTLAATVSNSATGTIDNTATVTAGTPDSNSSNNASTVNVTVGTATAALSTNSLAFGNQTLNTTSANQSFTISNTGNASLTITSLSMSGGNPGDFTAAAGTLPITLPAGTNVLVNVNFTPSSAGGRNAILSVNSNAGNGTQSVSLSGNGVATTTTALQSSLNPSYSGQNVTFTAAVTSTGGGTPSGTVTFKNGAATLATTALNSGAIATFSTSVLAAGNRSITAIYSGDGSDSTSTSAALKQVVNALPAATTTKVTTSGSPAFAHQLVTFTATINSGYGPIPNGETVTFYDGSVSIGSATTANGVATFNSSSLTVGSHSVKATYAGDSNLKTSSGNVSQVIQLYASTTMVTSNNSPSTYGQLVGLTATVNSSAPGGPSGSVTFKNGSAVLGTAGISGGVASLSTAKLPAGSLSITATYNGDSQSGKSAGTISQTVNQASSSASVSSSLNPSNFGQNVKFTVSVTSPTTLPVGSVTFMDGTTTLAAVNLVGGKAVYSTAGLTSGSHNITAVYAGTSNIAGSTSAVLVQNVN